MDNLKRFFFWLSKTDKDIIYDCPHNVQMNQLALGISVLITGLLAFFSGGYAIYTVFESYFTSFILALLYAFMIINIDREIVGATNKKAALIRFPIALIIGFIVALPLEIRIFEDRINQELTRQNKIENQAALNQVIDFENNFNDRRFALESEIKGYRDVIQECSRNMEAEAVGRVREGRTGIAGFGPAYDEAKRMKEETEYLLNAARTELNELNKTYDDELSHNQDFYNNQKINPVFDLLSKVEALESIKSQSAAAFWMAWGLRLLFILIEVLPALLKLFYRYDEYNGLLETRTVVNIQRIHTMGNEHIAEIEENPFKVPDPTFLQNIKQYPLAS